jgi:hypothetical protein
MTRIPAILQNLRIFGKIIPSSEEKGIFKENKDQILQTVDERCRSVIVQ